MCFLLFKLGQKLKVFSLIVCEVNWCCKVCASKTIVVFGSGVNLIHLSYYIHVTL